MPRTHKLVRDAVEAAMRDDTNGFNAQLAVALPFYGVNEPISLEWSERGVLYANIATGDFRLSTLRGRLTLEIAPDGSQWLGESRGIKWSGLVGVRLVFHVRYSLREEDELPEDGAVYAVAEAIEDAVIEVFQNYRGWSNGVIYARPPDCPEGYLLEYAEGDGYEITVPMRVSFKVDAV